MNKSEFIQLIDCPELLGTKQVSELKQILANFPYFTHARVLLTKAHHNEKHYEYEKYLKTTALAVPDREVLFHYLHDLTPDWLTSNTIKNDVAAIQSTATDKPEPIVEAPILSIENVMEKLVINEPEVIEAPITRIEITAETIVELNEEKVIIEDDEVELSNDELEADLVINTLLEESLVLQQNEDIVQSAVVTSLLEVSLLPEVVDVVNDTQSIINKTEEASEETELTFVEWLLQQNSPHKETSKSSVIKPTEKPVVKVIELIKNEEITQEIKPEIIEQSTIKPIEKDLPEVTKADIDEAVAKSNVNNFQNILDKFVKENPSISRPKAEFFNPVNMARQSVEEDDDLVTETLANLLYKQGNFKKAIKAYEKLCLLYPSKMSYFASLIQKIKTEQKD